MICIDRHRHVVLQGGPPRAFTDLQKAVAHERHYLREARGVGVDQ
jgi:hypothetical protein